MRTPKVTRGLIRFLFALYRSVKPFGWIPIGCCRYWPTCSDYAQQAIAEYGWAQGSRMALNRLLRCRPGRTGGIDLPIIVTSSK